MAQAQTHQLSSHILDISTGKPAPGVTVKLEKQDEQRKTWSLLDSKVTDENGRIKDFLPYPQAGKGIYRLTFLVSGYFKAQRTESFYPFIEVVFQIRDNAHYHVPITLSPYGYSTYRGN
ncbi:hydroxyisourate hydrolase [Rufibacter immobilis]